MKLSRYLRHRVRDGMIALFHELHPVPVYLSLAAWEICKIGGFLEDANLYVRLKERELVVESDVDDDISLAKVTLRVIEKYSRPTILYLMLAQGCNCRCHYCPVPTMAERYGEFLLSKEDAYAGIDLWIRHVRDSYDPASHYYIIFYGGEPLLNKETFMAIPAYLDKVKSDPALPKNLHLLLATNGTLIDETIATFCRTHDISVVVGLDGTTEQQHDAFRIYQDGKGTFSDVLRGITLLRDHDVPVYISASITPKNMHHLSELEAFLASVKIEKFGLNFLRGKQAEMAIGDLDAYGQKAVAQVIKSSYNWQPGSEYQIEKKVAAMTEGDFFPVDCTCYGNQLVIQADGQISHCPFAKPYLGNVRNVSRDFRISKTPIVEQWRKRLPLFDRGYRDCDAKSLCGGGCACSAEELTGDPLSMDQTMKFFAEEMFDELIWKSFDGNRVF